MSKVVRSSSRRAQVRPSHKHVSKLVVEALENRTAPATLVAAYAFNEGTGTTVADASGNGNNGTIANATWSAAGKFGKALSFNGTNARVNINDSTSLRLTTGMTLEAWVQPTAVTSAWRDVIYKGNDNYYLSATTTTNKVPAGGGIVNGSYVESYGTASLAANAWTYLAATYDGATMRLYVNGTQVATKAGAGSLATSSNQLQIGGDSIFGQYFSGTIDEVRIYNGALTAAQIQTDMTTPVSMAPDTQPPTAPGSLAVTAVSPTQLNLSWTASTDNVGVTGYLVERENPGSSSFVQVATTAGTAYSDAGLAAASTYSYRVRATDAAGNLSPYSTVANATTRAPDTQPPTAPSNLIATAVSQSQINLGWTASTDNVGVTGYLVYRENPGSTTYVQVGTTGGTTYSDTSLTASSTYSYEVLATDAAGNLSPYSNQVSATTQPLDTVPPVVTLTSPVNGAIVTATVAVTATASDNVGVAGVQFLLDGANLGAEDFSTPYSLIWNTATASRGDHTLSARARDAAGNVTTSLGVTITVVPQLVITGPANNASVTGPTVTVTYTTTGDLSGVDHPEFTLDNNPQVIPDFDFNGTLPLSNVPPGSHVIHGLLVSANRSPITGSDAAPINITVVAGDTTPPSVVLTTPTDGSTVAGTVSLSATATDNVGVVGVQFLLDGVAVGPEDTTAPYAFAWNSSTVGNGLHTLAASARDAAANSTVSNVVTVDVANANDPAQIGQWSSVMNWPLVAINMVLLDNGKILMWDGGPLCIGAESTCVWDPATGIFTPAPIPNPDDAIDTFCSGMTVLADGRVLVVGGHECNDPNYVGQAHAYVFDPATLQWTFLPDMQFRRYYPTATTLPDGRVLVTSGSDRTVNSYDSIPEVFDPKTNTWTELTGAGQTIPNYPFMFVLPNGNVLEAGSDEGIVPTQELNVNTQTWTVVDPRAVDGGSAVMYLPGMIMKAGSSYRTPDSVDVGPSAATTYVLNMTQPSPTWQQTASMAYARTHLNLTVLPDDNVVAIGGSSQIDGFYPSEQVLPAEMWSPATQTWTTMASEATPRMYHSTTLLLPDGRVLSAGGGRNGVTTADYLSAEIYSPPYLFKGPRPTITSAPTSLTYNSSFFIQTPDASNIASVALIQNGADTHANNMDQRYVPLTFTQGVGGLNVQSPVNNDVAVPGYYMLFIVNSNGVPSIAPFVRLPAPYEDTQPPTSPASLAASGAIGTTALSWNAATDDTGVVQYNVYRSATPGFTATAANQVGQTSTTSYTDTGLTAGTYYYQVIAVDTAGKISAPSNEASATVVADTIPPSVSLTSPADGGTVSGTIVINASASDNIGIGGVQFLLDGSNLGAEDTAAPYSTTWNTTTVAIGTHVLTARARDTGGNTTTSASITVTVQNNNLVLALGFNEGTGTTVTDSSGNGNNGTIANATWSTAGKFGKALSFNGTNARVNIPDSASLDLTTAMTLEAWVYPTTVTNAWRDVIYKGNDNYYLSATSMPNKVPVGGGIVNTSYVEAYGTAALTTNTWKYLAATYDGVTMRLYVNGVLVSSTAGAGGSLLTSSNQLQLGGDSIYGQYFKGLIDEVRVYNVARTAAQIVVDMNTAIGAAPALAQVSVTPGPLVANAISGSQANSTRASSTNNRISSGFVVGIGPFTASAGPRGPLGAAKSKPTVTQRPFDQPWINFRRTRVNDLGPLKGPSSVGLSLN
jgi:chitodextrinase